METTPGGNLSDSNSRKPKCQLKLLTLGSIPIYQWQWHYRVSFHLICASQHGKGDQRFFINPVAAQTSPHPPKWHTWKAVNITSRVIIALNLWALHVTSSWEHTQVERFQSRLCKTRLYHCSFEEPLYLTTKSRSTCKVYKTLHDLAAAWSPSHYPSVCRWSHRGLLALPQTLLDVFSTSGSLWAPSAP